VVGAGIGRTAIQLLFSVFVRMLQLIYGVQFTSRKSKGLMAKA
jgi:hypothetical protein